MSATWQTLAQYLNLHCFLTCNADIHSLCVFAYVFMSYRLARAVTLYMAGINVVVSSTQATLDGHNLS